MDALKSGHRQWPSFVVFGGLLLLYAGERIVVGADGVRYFFSGLGFLAVLAAAVHRVTEMGKVEPARKPLLALFTMATFGVMAALVLYGATTFSEAGEGPNRLRVTIHAVWLLLLAVSVGGLAALEIAVFPVAGIDRYEERKLRRYFQRGVGTGLVVASAVLFNYVATREDKKVDMSFGREAVATDQTRDLIKELSKPVRVVLFFPTASEVGDAVQQYMKSLEGVSSQLQVELTDQALAGKLASETGVSENGFIAVSHDKTHEKIKIGTDWDSSRSRIKKLDADFAKAVVKVTQSSKVAYFTVGHKERATDPSSGDTRPPLRQLKKILANNQYEVKSLGLGEGLGQELPSDHAIIFIMGPEKPFLPEEIATLKAGIDKGARLLIALEAEGEGDPMPELMAALGLSFDKTILVNEKAHVRVTRTPADAAYIVSNKYSSHKSVTTLTRNSSQLFTAFAKTGSLDKAQTEPPGVRAELVVSAMPETFADRDGDYVFDKATEVQKSYGLAAAVTRTATTGSDRETRVFVVSDVDVFTDDFLRNEGNALLLADIAYWLADVKEPVIPKVTEEDVRIQHRKEDDVAWFYSTTLGVPALVMALGFFVAGRRRKR